MLLDQCHTQFYLQIIQISWGKKTLSKHLYCNIWHYLFLLHLITHINLPREFLQVARIYKNKNTALLRAQNTHLSKVFLN